MASRRQFLLGAAGLGQVGAGYETRSSNQSRASRQVPRSPGGSIRNRQPVPSAGTGIWTSCHAPAGTVKRTDCSSEGAEGVEITVEDTGSGIREEDMEKIFQPFFTTKENGTGIGLAISHGIVQKHKGRISVESAVGKGTTFRIFLPEGEPMEDPQ